MKTNAEKLHELLQDGLPHDRDEVKAAIGDSETSLASIRYTIQQLRKILPNGQEVVVRMLQGQKRHYQLVQLLSNPYRD